MLHTSTDETVSADSLGRRSTLVEEGQFRSGQADHVSASVLARKPCGHLAERHSLLRDLQISQCGGQQVGRNRRSQRKEVRRKLRIFRLGDNFAGGLEGRHDGDLRESHGNKNQYHSKLPSTGIPLSDEIGTESPVEQKEGALTGGAIFVSP